MRFTARFLLGTAVVAIVGCPPPPPWRPADEAWETFKPGDGDYEVQMPGKPHRVEAAATDRLGQPQAVTGWELRRRDYPADFYVYSHPAPQESQKPGWLDALCENVARKKNGKVVDVKEIALDGHPGREALIEGNSDRGMFYELFRYYAANDKLYGVGVIMNTSDQAAAGYVKRFEDSFHFTDP